MYHSLIFQLVRICLQCRRPRFDSWVGKICWGRDNLPTPVFLGFPYGSSTCSVGDQGSIPALGRSPRETGLILRCAGKAGNPFQTTQGNRLSCRDQEGRGGSEEAVPGPSVFPSGEPGVSGDFWGSQEGCQGPFRPSGRNMGLPWRHRELRCSPGVRPVCWGTLGSHQGCQVAFRTLRWNVGLLLRL